MKRLIICFLMSSLLLPVFAQKEEDFDRLIRKGIELNDRGHFNEALKCYQECLTIRPESMIPFYEMAYTYACMNHHRESSKCADKALLIWVDNEQTDKITFYVEALSLYITLVVADKEQPVKTAKK